MLDAGLPEKVIMDRKGHHSLDGLKPYARVTDVQQQQVSSIMTHEIQPSTSVPEEVWNMSVLQDVGNTKDLGAKVEEKVKGNVCNNEISGCTFNITLKM